MNGKMIYLWKGRQCAGGDLVKTVQECRRLGLSAVALKIADAVDETYASYPDFMPQAVATFKAAGFKVWGWQYIYGGVVMNRDNQIITTNGPKPDEEGDLAVREVRRLGLDGYIIDAEREYKVFNQAERARRFTARLAGLDVPVALSSFRFPSLHPEFPFREFLAGCDVHMPQVYWGPGKAESDLDRSMLELRNLRALPFCPVGRAYIGDGHPDPQPGELKAFMQRAVDRGCVGVNFWSLDHLYMHTGGAGRADAIAGFEWPAEEPPPPVQVKVVQVTASNYLNIRDAPAGVDRGDLKAGLRFYVFETRDAGGYTWGKVGERAWIAIGPGMAEYV